MQHWGHQHICSIPRGFDHSPEGLSKEEKWGMQTLADEWNEEGPPSEQKRK